MVIRLIFKMETEVLITLRQILFICVVGLIPTLGKLVIFWGEFTFKLLELNHFPKLSADGLSLLNKIFCFYGESIIVQHSSMSAVTTRHHIHVLIKNN